MNNTDYRNAIKQLKFWVDNTLSYTDSLNEIKLRYSKIDKVMKDLKQLDHKIPENLRREYEKLNNIISNYDKLKDLEHELCLLCKVIKTKFKSKRRRKILTELTGRRALPKKLRVSFPDGKEFFETRAIDTFIIVLQYIGLQRISKLPAIKIAGYPLVSTHKNTLGRSIHQIDKYFIETHSSTNQKANLLKHISNILMIELSVNIIDNESGNLL